MKVNVITVVLCVFLSCLLFPLTSLELKAERSTKAVATQIETVDVMRTKTQKMQTVSLTEYLTGVVAAEMPMSYSNEALKAQTVAAHTYMLFRSKSYKEYDITDDCTADQCYIDKSERKEKWGEKYKKYEKRLKEAVKKVKNYIIYYKNEPILAVYFALSSGKTETAENVWGKEYKYLKSVQSASDVLAENYLSSTEFSASDLASRLQVSEESLTALLEPTLSKSGTVLSVNFGDKQMSGQEIRSALELKSACFEVKTIEGGFAVEAKGIGHNVGMSQYGAEAMAENGSTFEKILSWYYPNCVMRK